jgi:hypothetical protein
VAGPIARLANDASPASVGAEVLAALAESQPGPGVPTGEATKAFRAALRAAGWTMGAFDAAAHVDVTPTTAGELTVTGLASGREVRVAGSEPQAIGAAV